MSALETPAAAPSGCVGCVLRIAARNLLRYRRRTLLTTGLIAIGVLAVLLFVALAGSFRAMMVGQITDAMLGHFQVHRKGYVASIDNLPLNLNMSAKMVERLNGSLSAIEGVEAVSPRLKFGAMFSNFAETTNIRIVAVDPAREVAVTPLLPGRLLEGKPADGLVGPRGILVPELLARGMKVKVGDEVVLVATNRDGSVNGMTFQVQGILGSVTGPGGRDGYVRIEDARTLLRMTDAEVSEIAVRVGDASAAAAVAKTLAAGLDVIKNPQGKPVFEVHSWEQLTPFYNIARMIDLMTLFIQVMLVSIVLISVMNVMMMAVYERIREIGTIAAIGTQPNTILGLFLSEGLLLGVAGAAAGTIVSLIVVAVLNVVKVSFKFGQQENLVLAPAIGAGAVAWTAAVVIAVAVLASLQPAWKAARMDPNAALRHV
ncbi:ABC transporter permease [Shumkonia mesophila]|uniref:ABC transporter permease n=1 Tax=Shumkonia mesophila TaxID=2838854 RepID=UPI00293513FE|nr:ABC transporter permease [Shumkonia mesophila]